MVDNSGQIWGEIRKWPILYIYIYIYKYFIYHRYIKFDMINKAMISDAAKVMIICPKNRISQAEN